MNSKELLETYPKAADVVRKHFMEKLLESLNDADLPDDFKEFARQQEIDNEKISGLIDSQPRGLFDVFDANGICISIVYGPDGFTWKFAQLPFSETKDTAIHLFRKDAEVAAIEKAFEILNDKL
jgi:hypothetical protein